MFRRFILYSENSARLDAHPLRLLLEEVRRELHARRNRLGRVKPSDDDRRDAEIRRGINIMCSIEADLALGGDAGVAFARSWTDKVHELRREIALRRSWYPVWVDRGTLAPDAARRQLAAMESLHDLYWTHDQGDEAKAARAQVDALPADKAA